MKTTMIAAMLGCAAPVWSMAIRPLPQARATGPAEGYAYEAKYALEPRLGRALSAEQLEALGARIAEAEAGLAEPALRRVSDGAATSYMVCVSGHASGGGPAGGGLACYDWRGRAFYAIAGAGLSFGPELAAAVGLVVASHPSQESPQGAYVCGDAGVAVLAGVRGMLCTSDVDRLRKTLLFAGAQAGLGAQAGGRLVYVR